MKNFSMLILMLVFAVPLSHAEEAAEEFKLSIKEVSAGKLPDSKFITANIAFLNNTGSPYSVVVGGATITLIVYDGARAEISKFAHKIPANPNSSNSIAVASKFDLPIGVRFNIAGDLPEKGFLKVKYEIDKGTKIDVRVPLYSSALESSLYSFESLKSNSAAGVSGAASGFIIKEIKDD